METITNTVPVSNPDDYIPTGEYNPHNLHPWLLGNEYGILAIAYASNLQDALDIAADAGNLKGLAVDEADVEVDEETGEDIDVMRLGGASEPFDSGNAWAHELPNMSPDALAAMDEHTLFNLGQRS